MKTYEVCLMKHEFYKCLVIANSSLEAYQLAEEKLNDDEDFFEKESSCVDYDYCTEANSEDYEDTYPIIKQ